MLLKAIIVLAIAYVCYRLKITEKATEISLTGLMESRSEVISSQIVPELNEVLVVSYYENQYYLCEDCYRETSLSNAKWLYKQRVIGKDIKLSYWETPLYTCEAIYCGKHAKFIIKKEMDSPIQAIRRMEEEKNNGNN